MQKFSLPLPDNRVVTGAHSIPLARGPAEYRPLVVALHGGCYDHQYFDALPKSFSASVTSTSLGVPIIAIDRPSYGGTSSVLPIPKDSDFTTESAIALHQLILPHIWAKFGKPSQCNCIVLLCHSLGAVAGIATAALHARDQISRYPLGGLIVNAKGNTQRSAIRGNTQFYHPIDNDHVLCPVQTKDAIMFTPGTYAPEMLAESDRLNAVPPLPEIVEFPTTWMPSWKEMWASDVRAPVMFCLVEDDPFFVTTQAELECCVRAFTESTRVDGSLIRGAPHCLELSHWAMGLYARCFGFALECAAEFSLNTLGDDQNRI